MYMYKFGFNFFKIIIQFAACYGAKWNYAGENWIKQKKIRI